MVNGQVLSMIAFASGHSEAQKQIFASTAQDDRLLFNPTAAG
jgi:hypothetical protein